jgi:hypothetical protein
MKISVEIKVQIGYNIPMRLEALKKSTQATGLLKRNWIT